MSAETVHHLQAERLWDDTDEVACHAVCLLQEIVMRMGNAAEKTVEPPPDRLLIKKNTEYTDKQGVYHNHPMPGEYMICSTCHAEAEVSHADWNIYDVSDLEEDDAPSLKICPKQEQFNLITSSETGSPER